MQNPSKIASKLHKIVKSIQNCSILKGFEGFCPVFLIIYV